MGGEVAGGVLPWLAGCCGGDRWWRTAGAAGQRRVRPAGRAAAAGRQRWRRLGTLAVALGREVDAGGATGGGGL